MKLIESGWITIKLVGRRVELPNREQTSGIKHLLGRDEVCHWLSLLQAGDQSLRRQTYCRHFPGRVGQLFFQVLSLGLNV